jgi:hypothetical protein
MDSSQDLILTTISESDREDHTSILMSLSLSSLDGCETILSQERPIPDDSDLDILLLSIHHELTESMSQEIE